MYTLPLAGLLKPGQQGFVFKLKTALYGLKQARCEWQKTLTTVMTNNLGFKRSEVDHSVYLRQSGNEHTIIAVVTNDMVVISK